MRTYLEMILIVVVAGLVSAFFYERANNSKLDSEKMEAERGLKAAQTVNEQNASAMEQLQRSYAISNMIAAQTQQKIEALSRQTEGMKEEILTNVPESNSCVTSPSVRAALDWMREHDAPASHSAGKADPKANPVNPAPVPLPSKNPERQER
jgi:uncharacterized protein HemX